jgi:hypothetical protein
MVPTLHFYDKYCFKNIKDHLESYSLKTNLPFGVIYEFNGLVK